MAKEAENKILEVARKQFVNNGYAATRMDEIAKEAGYNKALVHYYFRSKEKLFREIIVQILNTFIPRVTYALKQEGTFWEKTELLLDTYLTLFLEQPDIPFFMMSELSQKRENFVIEIKKRASYFPAITDYILQMHKEMEEGKLRKIPPVHLLLNVMSMTVFPFISKPVFATILEYSDEEFEHLMKERKEIVMDFLKHALQPA
ncbi:MAG: helix-turn-helix domain-containing protein [Bacteroidota bacterium]